MVGHLASNYEISGRIEAFAPVSGAFYPQYFSGRCSPSRSLIPILESRGSNDTIIRISAVSIIEAMRQTQSTSSVE